MNNDFLITHNFSAPLSNEIKKEYNNLIKTISLIPKGEYLEKRLTSYGNVSVADIIAYQIGWGNLLLYWYETGKKGKMPEMPGEGFTKWDYAAIAEHFFLKYQYDSLKSQLAELHALVHKIIDFVEHEYSAGNLDKLGVWDWCTLSSGKQWPLSKWVKVNTVAPYKRATRELRKFL